MADQDFNIKVVTTADTTGLRQTRDEIEKTRQAAEKARQDIGSKALFDKIPPKGQETPPTPAAEASSAGTTGTAIGIGTIVTLLTAAISKWKEFSDEQDRWVDGMIKAQEKSRELGLSVADMLDAMKSAERIDTEPLQVSFDRLKQKVGVLKTEMNLAFGAGQYEDVKRIAGALGVVESQLGHVTSAIQKQASESEKISRKGQEEAYGASTPTAKAILENEKASREARARGDQKSAEQLEATAKKLFESSSPEDQKSYQDVINSYPKPPELSDIEKNKKAFEDYWKQPGIADVTGQTQEQLPPQNIPPKEDMYPTPIQTGAEDPKEIQSTLNQILTLMKLVWGY